ncbi:MAG TPA: hypothetical protein VK789_31640 [Bryobacteraceae bacterium]|nr:hypothetical protein [Bryobacteraceae bacterium]
MSLRIQRFNDPTVAKTAPDRQESWSASQGHYNFTIMFAVQVLKDLGPRQLPLMSPSQASHHHGVEG